MTSIYDPYLGQLRDDRVTLAALAAVGVRPLTVVQYDAPYLLAPSGTFSDTSGAFTLGTALTVAPNGATPGGGNCYVYLPAGAGGLSAGWREAFFATATTGYLIGLPATTATAWTSSTGIIALPSLTIPGGALGPRGRVDLHILGRSNATAGTKSFRCGLSGATTGLFVLQATTLPATRATPVIANRTASRQVVGPDTGNPGVSSGATPYYTINTDADWTITPSLQCAVATDWAMVDYAAATCTYAG